MTRYPLRHGEIIRARVESVYPTIADGSVALTIMDGPYGMSKASWDRVKDLAAFYRPHIAEVSRVSAPSASVYFWNTAEGWAAVHPEWLAAGWTFRSLIVWDKLNTIASMSWKKADKWPSTHEVCGFYSRGAPWFQASDPRSVWTMAVQGWASERLTVGEPKPHRANNQEGVGCMVAEAVHNCQKPLLFARRMIEASSRPGDLVFAPFGGTCREAVANEQIAQYEPDNARRTLTVEMDEDGREYIAAVLASLEGGVSGAAKAAGQLSMFGGAA